jgi:putative phage-type endonuclease
MMEILNCEQLSDEWMQARIGSIGGSSIASVVAGGQGTMRKNLLYRLVGELLSGVKYEAYSNKHMERGIEQEPDARNMYEFVTGNEVTQVGLVKASPYKHYSPDGLVDKDGMIESKAAIPSVQVERILNGTIEGNYKKQMQWGLWICERQWCDFVSYSPLVAAKPIWIKRIQREETIMKEMNMAADKFIGEMLNLIKKIKEG